MAGRGRGRGKGMSFNVEVLGFGRGETLPGSSQQPPPLFPPVTYKAVPLAKGEDSEYMLALKQEFRGAMRKSPFFLDLLEKKKDIERYSDKYQLSHQDTCSGWTPDWRRIPNELKIRPKKMRRNRNVKPNVSKARTKTPDVDIVKTLETLEKVPEEVEGGEEEGEKKKAGEEEEEEAEEFYEEEELEEETDYNLCYFDNGEGYGDDDDDVDEGPVY